MITIHTMPMCSGCEQVKEIAKSMKLKYLERQLNPNNAELRTKLRQNQFNGQARELMVAPIIESDTKAWPAKAIQTEEKIKTILIEADNDIAPPEPKKHTDRPTKQRKKEKEHQKPTFELHEATNEWIEKTIIKLIKATSVTKIEEIVNTEITGHRGIGSFLIGYRFAQHQKAIDLEKIATQLMEEAKRADPYRKW